MERRWKRCLREEKFIAMPSLWSCNLLNALMVSTARELHPPNVSTAKGTNTMPSDLQFWSWVAIFRASATWRAWPWVTEASWTKDRWRGETTVTSTATGNPRFQEGRKMSAGREQPPWIKDGTSKRGERAAEEKRTSRRALCRVILSPFPPHSTKWSPKGSLDTSE